jgi:hypothetical protein
MKIQKFLLVVSMASILLLGCNKLPEACSEQITTDPNQTITSIDRIRQMNAEGFFQFDLDRLKSAEIKKIGILLASTNTGKNAPAENINADYIEATARAFKNVPEQDKMYFLSYHGNTEEKYHVVQISVEQRLKMNASSPEIIRVTKTGYFDAEGNLVCIMDKSIK